MAVAKIETGERFSGLGKWETESQVHTVGTGVAELANR